MKVLIVGGVAGGASAAARLRRNDESAQIILFERGEYISFANCGLPYYIGGVIREKSKLTVQTPESFHARFNVDIRTQSEVIAIDREKKTVRVRKAGGSVYEESYDKLLLSPGAEPLRPNFPGFDGKKVFTLRNIPDTYKIKDFMDQNSPKSAVVVGGGYIGIEAAENLHRQGIKVTIVELSPHIIPPVDADTAAQLHNHLRSKGVDLRLGTGVSAIEEKDGGLLFTLSRGEPVKADFCVLAAGVSPESKLAGEAGLALGMRNAIAVNEYMQTSDGNIYAVGDAVQVSDAVLGGPAFIPLASPANRQGRIAADNICGKQVPYDGAQGSSILGVFDMTMAATGLSEGALQKRNIPYLKSFTYSPSNASYYPGGLPMSIKLLFSPDTGRVLGAQAVGFAGVDKRVDVIAAVIRLGGKVSDLTRLELCYAPPFSSAKDPVNMAGYAAENILKGMVTPFYAEDVEKLDPENTVLVDVRTPMEFANGTLPGAINLPLDSLRQTFAQLPRDKEIAVFCQIGLRGYLASRILTQQGFANVRNLSGGYRLWKEMQADSEGAEHPLPPVSLETETQLFEDKKQTSGSRAEPKKIQVDACGLSCPGPILAVSKAMEKAEAGDIFTVAATDPAFAGDIAAFCRRTGNKLLDSSFDGRSFQVTLEKGGEAPSGENASALCKNEKSIIVFSGDLDKAIASFIIANGALAMGRKVNMFFTFWGLTVLRKPERVNAPKDFMGRMFGKMMPRGSEKLALSKMNMGGMGAKMIRSVMKNKNISSLEDLIKQAMDLGVHITACSMSMDVMGIKKEELIDGVEIGGVAGFLSSAEESDMSLFI